MPRVSVCQRFPHSQARVMALFRRPALVVAVAPAEWNLRLVEAPDEVVVGSRIVVDVRRYGIRQRLVTEVVRLEVGLMVEEQRHGPFAAWRHTRLFSAVSPEETEVEEEIEFAPPGGMLGLVMTASRIEADLRAALEGRHPRLLELLAESGRHATSG